MNKLSEGAMSIGGGEDEKERDRRMKDRSWPRGRTLDAEREEEK